MHELTRQQETELAHLWRQNGDHAARNVLVQSQLGYALFVARSRNRPGESIDELLAEGSLGLIHAANRFDPDRGYRFFTYAKHWVHVYVSKYATGRGLLRRTRLLAKVRRERARALSLVGEGLEMRRVVAERLNLSDEQAEALFYAVEQREVSFDAMAPEQIASESRPDQDGLNPEQALLERFESVDRRLAVDEVLRTLDPRERCIVDRRLMVDNDAVLTLDQLGKEFGVSRERVHQLERRLKQKLARQLQHLAPPGGSSTCRPDS